MEVKQLYPHATKQFVVQEVCGKYFLVNPDNVEERENIIRQEGADLYVDCYEQKNSWILVYKGKIFQFSGVKAFKAVGNSKFCLLLGLGEDDFVYFYTIAILDETEKDIKVNKVECRDIGSVKINNFEYFRYFYQKDLELNIRNQEEFERFLQKKYANKSESVFIFDGMVAALQNEKNTFYLKAFGNGWEAFESKSIPEKVTTFFKVSEDFVAFSHIHGTDFKVLSSSRWIDRFSSLKGWRDEHKDWILTPYNLTDLQNFQIYTLRKFSHLFKKTKATPWRISERESLVFLEEELNGSSRKKILKTGVLWDMQTNQTIPNRFNATATFWHWNKKGIPHVTIEDDGENEIYQIWYREEGQNEFKKIDCIERPIVFYDLWDRHIYFVKTQNSNFMLVLNHRLEQVFKYENVTFFEEITPFKKYPHQLKRSINEKGQYFASSQKDNYELKSQNILILKQREGTQEKFCIYWNNEKLGVNSSIPFISYQFEKMKNNSFSLYSTEILTIEAETSMEDVNPYTVCILKEKIISVNEVLKANIKDSTNP